MTNSMTGYGICFSYPTKCEGYDASLWEPTVKAMKQFITSFSTVKRNVEKMLAEDEELRSEFNSMNPDDSFEAYDFFENYESDCGYSGYCALLADGVKDAAKSIPLGYVEGEEDTYLLYMPRYPWDTTTDEKNMTEDDFVRLFTDALSILTPELPLLDEYTAYFCN